MSENVLSGLAVRRSRGRTTSKPGIVVALPLGSPYVIASMADSVDWTMADDWLSRSVEVKEAEAICETNTSTMPAKPVKQGSPALHDGTISLFRESSDE
jgi:hypothetical protein